VHYLLHRTRRPGRCRRKQTRNVEHVECALLLVNCTVKMVQSTSMDLETIHVLVHISHHNPTPYGPLTFSLTDNQLLRSSTTHCQGRMLPCKESQCRSFGAKSAGIWDSWRGGGGSSCRQKIHQQHDAGTGVREDRFRERV